MIRRGRDWGVPVTGPPDLEVAGDDAALAAALAGAGPDPLVRFSPSPAADLARALGLGAAGSGAGLALPLDALRLGDGRLAVNAVVAGVTPDRLRFWHRRRAVEVEVDGVAHRFDATTVVTMTGQFLRGFDVSPRGHPGDGICEVQVYRLAASHRRPMRARLRSGSHLPHPSITTRRGRRVRLRFRRPVTVEVDGHPSARAAQLDIEVLPGAYRLLV